MDRRVTVHRSQGPDNECGFPWYTGNSLFTGVSQHHTLYPKERRGLQALWWVSWQVYLGNTLGAGGAFLCRDACTWKSHGALSSSHNSHVDPICDPWEIPDGAEVLPGTEK